MVMLFLIMLCASTQSSALSFVNVTSNIYSLTSSSDTIAVTIESLIGDVDSSIASISFTTTSLADVLCTKIMQTSQSIEVFDQGTCSALDQSSQSIISFYDSIAEKVAQETQEQSSITDELKNAIQQNQDIISVIEQDLCSKLEQVKTTALITDTQVISKLDVILSDTQSIADNVTGLYAQNDSLVDDLQDTLCSSIDSLAQVAAQTGDVVGSLVDGAIEAMNSAGDNLFLHLQSFSDALQMYENKGCSIIDALTGSSLLERDTVQSKQDNLTETIFSVSDQVELRSQSNQMLINNATDFLCSKVESFETELYSFGDVASQSLNLVNQSVISVSDTVLLKLNEAHQDVFSISDQLCEKIIAIEQQIDLLEISSLDALLDISTSIFSVSDKVLDTMQGLDSFSDVIDESQSVLEIVLEQEKDEIVTTFCDKSDSFERISSSIIDVLAVDNENTKKISLSHGDEVCAALMSAQDLVTVLSQEAQSLVDATSSIIQSSALLCSKVEGVDNHIVSMADAISGPLGMIADINTSLLDTLCPKLSMVEDNLLSVSDVLTESIMSSSNTRVSGLDTLCMPFVGLNETLESISDVLTTTTSGQLGSICDFIASALDVHDENIVSKLDDLIVDNESLVDGFQEMLTSVVDEVQPCVTGTEIRQSDIPITLSTSGIYTLCENVGNFPAAPIVISGDDITLNLNGFKVISGGISIITGAENIEVFGGRVDNTTSSPSVSVSSVTNGNIYLHDLLCDAHILIEDSTHVRVEDCTIVVLGFPTAQDIIVRGSSDNIFISRCYMTPRVAGIGITTALSGTVGRVFITDCIAYSGSGIGYLIEEGTVVVKNCLALSAPFDLDVGFEVCPSVGKAVSVLFDGCGSEGAEVGFNVGDTTGDGSGALTSDDSVIIKNCYSRSSRTVEFLIGNNVYLENCIAFGGGPGFQITGSNTVCYNCISRAISREGFTISTTSVLDTTFEYCDAFACASFSGGAGFDLAVVGSPGAVLKNCLASHNSAAGIDDNGTALTILDTRSAANGAADVTGSSTVITY